jgi:hypothetical protein
VEQRTSHGHHETSHSCLKNVKKIPFWKAEHPTCEDTSTQKYIEYIAILNQVMTGIHPDKETDIDKIVRNVAHSVVLDKISTSL